MAIMGILNVTPDSFSDGGCYLDPAHAVHHAHELIRQGAEIIDIGGESTRPNADPVSEAEELRRVMPVIERLAGQVSALLSIDTRKVTVAQAAVAAGASVINDVAASQASPDMWRLVAASGAGYVCMHAQGTPQTMQRNPLYGDVVGEVDAFFRRTLEAMTAAGVHPDQVVLDVGIGFGKSARHNLELLANLDSFKKLGRPLLLGASRKSFIGKFFGVEVAARLPGSLACASWASLAGVSIVRTHDVAATRQNVRLAELLQEHRRCLTG